MEEANKELQEQVKELKQGGNQLEEAKKIISEDCNHKVAELTQPWDEEDSRRRRLDEVEKHLAVEKVSATLFPYFRSFPLLTQAIAFAEEVH